MSGRWQALADTLDVMFSGNFPDFYLQSRNRTFTRPTAPKTSGPPRYIYYDFGADDSEVRTVGRTRKITGNVGGLIRIKGNQGDVTMDCLDRMETIADAWASTGEAGNLLFYGVIPQELVAYGDADSPKWCVREFSLPFLYNSPVTTEGEAILGGLSNSIQQIDAPSLALLDFVGSDNGVWRRVKASEGEPACLGMVSAVLDSGPRLITFSGYVRIAAGHGFALGPLYLSQDTLGAAGAEPESGLKRKVAEVINSTDLIVLSGPEVAE